MLRASKKRLELSDGKYNSDWFILMTKREGSGSYLSDGKYNSDWFILSLADLSINPGIHVW